MTVKAEQRQKAAAVSSSAPRLSSLITSLLLCHSQLWSLPSLGLCRIKSFDVGLLRDTTVAPEPLSRSSATTHRLCDLPALRLPQALLTLWGAAACGVESLYNVQNQTHNRKESVDWKPGGRFVRNTNISVWIWDTSVNYEKLRQSSKTGDKTLDFKSVLKTCQVVLEKYYNVWYYNIIMSEWLRQTTDQGVKFGAEELKPAGMYSPIGNY